MKRLSLGLLLLPLLGIGAPASLSAPRAWPHRARLQSVRGDAVRFRAYSLGGDLVTTGDAHVGGKGGTQPRVLSLGDTLRATTPAHFPLDLSKGPVVFVVEAEGSLHLSVGWNPNGSVRAVDKRGRGFRVHLVGDQLVIDEP